LRLSGYAAAKFVDRYPDITEDRGRLHPVIVNPSYSSTYGRIAPDTSDQAYCCLKIGYFTSCPPGKGRTQLIAELQESVSYGDSSAAEEEQTAMVQQA
jgi:hypothetical protein